MTLLSLQVSSIDHLCRTQSASSAIVVSVASRLFVEDVTRPGLHPKLNRYPPAANAALVRALPSRGNPDVETDLAVMRYTVLILCP